MNPICRLLTPMCATRSTSGLSRDFPIALALSKGDLLASTSAVAVDYYGGYKIAIKGIAWSLSASISPW